MTDNGKRPLVLVFAGPNGSGKSTATKNFRISGVYVNADDMKKELGLSDLEAAQRAEARRNELLANHFDFTFETVLSTERNLLLLQNAKQMGYEIQCIYVLTCDANINVARIRDRVAAGGHAVPEDKIRTRYYLALSLIPRLVGLCDKIAIYDNSYKPELIFRKEGGREKIFPNKYWPKEALLKLLGMH